LSVPATLKLPSSMTMSFSDASSWCETIFFALASTFSSAFTIAERPTAADREP
jgi:hypothetical protein